MNFKIHALRVFTSNHPLECKVVWVQSYIERATNKQITTLCRTNDYGHGYWSQGCAATETVDDKRLWTGGAMLLNEDEFDLSICNDREQMIANIAHAHGAMVPWDG